MSFRHIKVGDRVKRQMGINGPIMELKVTKVDDDLIHCGDWMFNRDLGCEEDPELNWGKAFGASGSTLIK